MRTDTQGQVIAALTTKSPMTRAELLHETDLSNDQLSNAIYNLKKRNLITGSRDTYALAVGQTSAPAAKAVKPVAKIPCGPSAPTFASRLAVESVNGTDSKDQAPPTLRFDMMDIRPTCTRAIATADGGCIVIDGAMIIAELNKEQREAVAAAA